MVSRVGPSSGESLRLAAAATVPSGMPRASVTVERLWPCLPRSTGLRPAASPPQGAFGDAAIHREVAELQADHLVICLQDEQLQGGKDPGGDPLVAAVADGGRRAGLVGDLAVATAEHQHLDELVEDDPVGHASPVAAQGVVGVVGAAVGQQCTELVP
jgi:hypothetical protein